MKKLLSILAAVGLTATSSTAVVSCSIGSSIKTKTIAATDLKFDDTTGSASFEMKVTLPKNSSISTYGDKDMGSDVEKGEVESLGKGPSDDNTSSKWNEFAIVKGNTVKKGDVYKASDFSQYGFKVVVKDYDSLANNLSTDGVLNKKMSVTVIVSLLATDDNLGKSFSIVNVKHSTKTTVANSDGTTIDGVYARVTLPTQRPSK